jgi:hypothetical protein
MAGRTLIKWANVFVDGFDMTGFSRSFGPLTWKYPEADTTVLNDGTTNSLPSSAEINIGAINCILDNTTNASHDKLNTTQGTRIVTLAMGSKANPAQGDPVFTGQYMQKELLTTTDTASAVAFSASFTGWAAEGTTLLYSKPWGWLLHAKSAETAVNSAIGIDDTAVAASTTRGGYMVYHLISSNGSVTLKVQDAAVNNNGSFADLVTSGVLAASPASGIVALAPTATVRQFLRWQMVLGTATTATFIISFVRA